jgi:hypothetical protein
VGRTSTSAPDVHVRLCGCRQRPMWTSAAGLEARPTPNGAARKPDPLRPPALIPSRETGRHFEIAALIESEVIHLHGSGGPRIAHPYAHR